MKDINVCMVHWCYPPTIGGVETFLELLCENLVETGHKVHVITGDRRGRTIEKGIIVHGTDVLGDYRNNIVTIDEYKRCRNYFRKFLKKNKIDILHTHNFQRNFRPAITMAIYSAATEMSIPVVLHVHNPVTTPNATFLVSKIPWDMVFCVSDWITNDVKSMGVANRGAIKTIYNGVDTKKFKPGLDTIKIKKNLGVTNQKIILCPARFVKRTGAFHERKRLHLILKSLLELQKRFDNFSVVFTGKNKVGMRKIMQEAKRIRINDKVIFANVEFDDMPSLYNVSDLVVLPSVGEAFGMVYIEGMACGKPVIGCKDGGVPEVIVNGKTGYLVEPDNVVQLATKMEDLLVNEKKSNRFGQQGREHVQKKFGIAVIARKLDGQYKGLLDKS